MSESNQLNLVALAAEGDVEAFSKLLTEHYDLIYRVAFLWCGNQPDAQDVAQDTCIKVARAIRTFRGDSQFSTWLYRIVVNTAKDYLRKRTEHVDFDDIANVVTSKGPTPLDEIECDHLWRVVRQLPERQSSAVLMVYAQGLTHSEVAKILDCAENTVSWYIHEAKKQLREWIEHNE
ncbi:MAG: RNA polymerase sigma factor [Gammaproteobacteria bacterium]|nr:RNA polymerase sigma factor [Gammaproteobacteria bacterium]